jgi:hypothetical protein
MKKIIVTALALVMASSVPALSQTYRTEGREYHQDGRILRGAVRGQLTPQELRNLSRQQNRIDHSQRRAARDGYITPAERYRLERQQDRASRNIYRKTHNGRDLY